MMRSIWFKLAMVFVVVVSVLVVSNVHAKLNNSRYSANHEVNISSRQSAEAVQKTLAQLQQRGITLNLDPSTYDRKGQLLRIKGKLTMHNGKTTYVDTKGKGKLKINYTPSEVSVRTTKTLF